MQGFKCNQCGEFFPELNFENSKNFDITKNICGFCKRHKDNSKKNLKADEINCDEMELDI